jgi:hypothetical protein
MIQHPHISLRAAAIAGEAAPAAQRPPRTERPSRPADGLPGPHTASQARRRSQWLPRPATLHSSPDRTRRAPSCRWNVPAARIGSIGRIGPPHAGTPGTPELLPTPASPERPNQQRPSWLATADEISRTATPVKFSIFTAHRTRNFQPTTKPEIFEPPESFGFTN